MSDGRESSQDTTPPVPGKEKRETLSERAARVIGRPLDEIQYEAESGGTASGTGRRKQVLQAQRTHRLRTQQYIRELENEIFRLRDSENELRRKIEELQQRTSSFERSNVQNPTAGVNPGLREDLQTTSTSLSSSQLDTMNIDLTGLANVDPIGSCTVHPAEIPTPAYVQPPPPQWPQTVRLAQLDSQAAINFILVLERPCLPHIKHAHLDRTEEPPRTNVEFNSGPGHLLTLSSSLLHDHRLEQPDIEQLSVSQSHLERLLETSLKLPLTNETTPVQIWTRIKQLSTQYAVSEDMLYMLRAEFEKYVHCNSFGAVVDESIVQNILNYVFN